MKLLDLKLIAQCQCEKASYLASESIDRELTTSEIWAMRLHLVLCRSCRRVTRQLNELYRIVAEMPPAVRKSMDPLGSHLSSDCKQRIIAAMRSAK